MKQVSKKQSSINRVLKNIKLELASSSTICPVCHKNKATDLMHLLPRSTFPEYQTEKWNLILGCRDCHVKFDSDKEFRRNTKIGSHIIHIDKLAYNRYYG